MRTQKVLNLLKKTLDYMEREDALAEGKALTGTAYVDCIRKNLGLDLQQACAAIGISVEEYEKMKKVLTDN